MPPAPNRWTRQESAAAPGRWTRLLGEAAESLFATLFPSDCRLCAQPLTSISRLPVCPPCLAAMSPVHGLLCRRCGERLWRPQGEAQPGDDLLCPQCRRAAPPFARALAYGSYEGGLRELIHLLKYEQVRPAAGVLGRMLAEVLAHLAAGPDAFRSALLVPVPLHAEKLRQRGFNQAEEIARAALRLAPAAPGLELAAGILRRSRATQSQTGLTRHQRRENVRGAFRVEHAERLAGRDVVLVDDVLTTGTTVSECARVLLRAGAERVYVATVARVLKADAAGAELPEGADDALEPAPSARASAAHA